MMAPNVPTLGSPQLRYHQQRAAELQFLLLMMLARSVITDRSLA